VNALAVWTRGLAIVSFVLGVTAVKLQQSWLRNPAEWMPLEDVDLEEPPGVMARYQLNALIADREVCFVALDRSNLLYTAALARPVQNACGLTDRGRFDQSGVPYSNGFDLSFGMATALYWYESEVDRVAQEHLVCGLARIDNLGSYACRNIKGATAGRRSQHATANAIDVSGFVLSDGRSVSVFADWAHDMDEARFLHAAHKSACNLLNTVLELDYNAIHDYHFHLDMGRLQACR
jgi:hypothetical protein